MKIQYRIRSPNLVLLLSTSPNLHTDRDLQSRHIFDKMVDKDVVSWTTLIDGLVMGHSLVLCICALDTLGYGHMSKTEHIFAF